MLEFLKGLFFGLLEDTICKIVSYAADTALYSEFESGLRDTADWNRKWLVDFNTEKTQLRSFD